MIRGACNCGALRFEVHGSVEQIFACHCSLCRRFSGTMGLAVVVVDNARFRWTSETTALRRWRKPGHDWESNFCATCGSAVPGANDVDRMFVPAGAVTDGGEHLRVAHHIWVSSRAGWDVIGDNGRQHPGAFMADAPDEGDE